MKRVNAFFDNWDIFASPSMRFNLEGRQQIGTSIGCICTLCLAVLVVIYTGVRMSICIRKDNVLITTYKGINQRPIDEEVNITEYNFQMAFKVTNFTLLGNLHDPDFVEFSVTMFDLKNYEMNPIPIGFHPCTE